MADSLFEILMSFFEKSLSQITESKIQEAASTEEADGVDGLGNQLLTIQLAKETSMRIFTHEEQKKLTKASYQFLVRMVRWGVMSSEVFETVITQLLFSESRFVSLQETKWTIRNVLAETLTVNQLSFLDLVLYQQEDKLPIH